MKKLAIFVVVVAAIIAVVLILRRSASELMTAENSPLPSPSVSVSPGPSLSPISDQIQLYLPAADDKTVGSKFVMYGKGVAFENTLNYKINDAQDGRELKTGSMMTNAPDAGKPGFFYKELDIAKELKTLPTDIIFSVMELSAKDGSELHPVRRQLAVDSTRSTALYVYFSNDNLDPQISCSKAFAVARLVPKTQVPLRTSIEELLKGPVGSESGLGFKTSINSGVTINSVKLSAGTATIDFSKKIEENAGGSCRVASIRSQITNTAKQFPSVKNVVISVEGRVEDALQP